MSIDRFTYEDLEQILTEHVGLAASDLPVSLDTPFGELGLDSLAIVALQYGIEQRCGLEIPDGDARHLVSASAVIEYVNAHLALIESR